MLQLSHIPTVGGSSWPILSYRGGMRFVQHAKEIIQEGYEKASCMIMHDFSHLMHL
jgi:hypothetical protein